MTQSNSTKLRFEDLGIEGEILSILKKSNFTKPTPVQLRCIPKAIEGEDVVGIAQTGTGKTLAFVVPIIQKIKKNGGQALILTPTRELAIQVNETVEEVGKHLGFSSTTVIGGTPIYRQIKDLRKKPKIIVATPGRLIDHLNRKTLNLSSVKAVVLDEADHMFDIGFFPDVKRILSETPESRQTLLFSATMPSTIMHIITKFMKAPVHIQIAPSGTLASGLDEELFILNQKSKPLLLEKILSENKGKILIFMKTKISVRKTARDISKMNHSAVEIHSDLSLGQRKKAMEGFKKGKYRILVATDIAARGIDVSDISIVINYDLPQSSQDYVHRIGRTARSEAKGKAISFATPDQERNIQQIERLTKKTISVKNPSSDKNISFSNFNKKAHFSKKRHKNFYQRRK